MKKSLVSFGLLYLLVALAYEAYVVGKAWLVPITYDESATTSIFLRTNYRQLLQYDYAGITANNHVLNSVIAKAITSVDGVSAFALRSGNLLASIFYLFIGYLVFTRLFRDNLLRFAGLFLWLCNPYLSEFHALTRGYGMSASFEAGAVCFGALYLASEDALRKKRWYLTAACLFAALAVWANFATLNFFCCFIALILFDLWRKPGRPWLETGIVLGVAAGLGLLIKLPLQKIKAAGDFGYFGNNGYFKDTVQTFADCFTMGRKYFGPDTLLILQSVLIAVFALSLLAAFWQWWKNKIRLNPQTWMLGLFPFTVVANLLITEVTGSSFLNTRTTLFFYPLMVFAVLQLLALAKARSKALTWGIAVPLAAALAVNSIKNASWSDTYEWRFDRHTLTVLEQVKQMYLREGRNVPYDLRVHCLFCPSFKFYSTLSKSKYAQYLQEVREVNCEVPPPIDETADFYCVQRKYLDHFPASYELVFETDDHESILLRKK